ncbi:MAG: TolC family protein [Proteobacteria bacterium]|nr:TolC family protein [Cystobacterineae bacterium]MCL2258449.1 TolC family protein [Cystobacterineae bacterium]MCL2315212.1 TolC family protein [Pseudomonadota bacterium]
MLKNYFVAFLFCLSQAHAENREIPAPSPGMLPNQAEVQEVSLEEMLAFAQQHSPALLVAQSIRLRAEANLVAASALLPSNPELALAAGPLFGRPGTGVSVNASLMQQIYVAGERGLQMSSANQNLKLADAEIQQVLWEVSCDIREAFYAALLADEQLKLAQRILSFHLEVLHVVERQISIGETSPLSLRIAQAEVAQAQQTVVASQQTLLSARIQLAQLSGWPANPPPKPVGALSSPQALPSQEQLVEMAHQNLPRLQIALAKLQEAQARLTLSRRNAWPRPSVGLQYQYEGKQPHSPSSSILMGALSFPIPSFQTNQGEKSRSQAEVAISKRELLVGHQLLYGKIAQLRSEVLAAMERSRAYGDDILPRFEENLSLLRRAFELGEIDILSLSAGAKRFLEIRNDALNAQRDYFAALIHLEKNVGVGISHQTLPMP